MIFDNRSKHNHHGNLLQSKAMALDSSAADGSSACERFNTYNRGNGTIIAGYQGIPSNIIINIIASFVMLIIFLIVRKIAWRYSQAALLGTTEDSWSQFFYGNLQRRQELAVSTGLSEMNSDIIDDDIVKQQPSQQQQELPQDEQQQQQQQQQQQTNADKGNNETIVNANAAVGERDASMTQQLAYASSLKAGLLSFVKLTDADISKVAGKDAIRYIQLQRYLFFYLLLVTVFALSIVLPVNIHGGYTDKIGKFSRTTINNISGDSAFLWVHALLAGLYMLLAIGFMYHYSTRIVAPNSLSVNYCCLMIRNVPQLALDVDAIAKHFHEAYPAVTVTRVDLAYDIYKLEKLHDESLLTTQILQLCQEQAARSGSIDNNDDSSRRSSSSSSSGRATVTNCRCSWLCAGCCCGTQDAVGFYAKRLEQISDELARETELALKRKLPIVFVEFASAADAKLIMRDFRNAGKVCGLVQRITGRRPASSAASDLMQQHKWSVGYAPFPEDVNWRNLSNATSYFWYLRAIVINICLFILLFFFTTPLYFMTLLRVNDTSLTMKSTLISQFLPPLFMWLFSIVLPYVVYYSDVLIRHWKKSTEHFAVMVKCTMFLILMILILPSFGLSRADSLVQWMFSINDKDSPITVQRWRCVFVSENASFFINYVITSAMIGCCADLLRVSEMIWYAINWLGARSKAEAQLVFKKIVTENEYGFNLSWVLCIFAIVMTYANVAPLILVFGILYLVMKMLVDRYNIYFAYRPSVMDRSVLRLAQTIALLCVLMGQVAVAGFFLLRIPDTVDSRTICILAFIVLSLGYLFSRCIIRILIKCHCVSESESYQEHSEPRNHTGYKPRVFSQGRYTSSNAAAAAAAAAATATAGNGASG